MQEPDLIEALPEKGKGNWKKIILIVAGIIIVLGLLTLTFVNEYINKSLPQVEGVIQIPRLQEEVVVTTAEHGVPHILAANDHDLYMA